MKTLAWLVAVLLIVAGLYAVDWSLAALLAFSARRFSLPPKRYFIRHQRPPAGEISR